MNATLQRKSADFSKLNVLLQFTLDELKSLKVEAAEWCSSTESTVMMLESEYGIEVGRHAGGSARSRFVSIKTMREYRSQVAGPYIDSLLDNINTRFSDGVVKLLVAMSVFNPAKLPTHFYGREATVVYQGASYTSPPLLDREELIAEWKVFRRAFYEEKELMVQARGTSTPSPTMQEVLQSMQATEVY